MRIGKKIVYLEKGESIIPVPLDKIVKIYNRDRDYSRSSGQDCQDNNRDRVAGSIFYIMSEDNEMNLEYDKDSYNSVKKMLSNEIGSWIETSYQGSLNIYNPVYIDIKNTTESNINIRGKICTLVLGKPGSLKPAHIEDVYYPEYIQIMKSLKVENPWAAVSKDSDVIRKFLEDIDLILTHNRTSAVRIKPFYRKEYRFQQNKGYEEVYTDRIGIDVECNWADRIEDVLSLWRELGIRYHEEKVQIRGMYYLAYIPGEDNYKTLIRKLADRRKESDENGGH